MARHGKKHMQAIGQKGFATTVARHWGGSKSEYLAHQRQLANQALVEALTDIQLRVELAGGKDVASVELGPMDDYEPQHWRDRVRSGREETSMDLPW